MYGPFLFQWLKDSTDILIHSFFPGEFLKFEGKYDREIKNRILNIFDLLQKKKYIESNFEFQLFQILE